MTAKQSRCRNRWLNGDKKTSGIIMTLSSVSSHSRRELRSLLSSDTRDSRSSVENPSRRYPVDFRYPSILSWLASSQQCQRCIVVSQDNLWNPHRLVRQSHPVHLRSPRRRSACTEPGSPEVHGEAFTAAAFQPADQEFSPLPTLQPHGSLAGIPVGKRLPADRTVGYGAALNKKYHFRDCK